LIKKIILFVFLVMAVQFSFAQLGSQFSSGSGTKQDTSGGSKKDSVLGFVHRDDAKDSITVGYRYLDSIRLIRPDSSINDFYRYFTMPAGMQFLGNNGSAAYPLVYTPFMKAGWDPGFHAFDIYSFTLENSKFYKTTKPFSQLDYQLAGGKEQTLHALYTNNLKKNLNVGFEYKLISAPGLGVLQLNNDNSYRLFGNYQGTRKRYALYFLLVGNSLKSEANGGIQNDSFLTSKYFPSLAGIPVNLGSVNAGYAPNPFSTVINTGTIYSDFTLFLRQTYDIGKKDSAIINDTTTEYLFYPKLRFQYTLSSSSYSYQYVDNGIDNTTTATNYLNWYNMNFPGPGPDSFSVTQKWSILKNDFSLIQFPDTKNQAEFFLAGARLESITGSYATAGNISSSSSIDYYYHNIVLHAEYRNRTRNRKWDIEANGELYANGLNSGDYTVNASLYRYLNKKWGNIRLSFNNINRSQSFVYNPLFSFNEGNTTPYKKENITVFKATADNSFVNLFATDYFITNLAYFTDYYHSAQDGNLINLLQLGASKKIKLTKHWNWYADIVVQETDQASPIKVPLVYTRNRIAYEGVFFKNLNLSTGIEFRYYTPYKGYNFSPVVGQFFVQDTVTLNNRPDISAFLQFRIKSFTAFVRLENLNTIDFTNGFGFDHYNFAAPSYVYPGMVFRLGVRWWFVN